ncbi:O-antigen ligase family protein [Neobacillus sp. NPDC093182]|uniref:O-antigen ligase family protein n=1 Tax=Neobacillus sp. NPDC093182 TaxID=3364297 RepID=UPI003821F73A
MVINRKDGLEALVKYIIILLFILNSKTVYFGVIHSELTQYSLLGLFVLGIFLFRISVRAVKINLTRYALLFIFIMINILINFSDMASSHFNTVIIFLVNIMIICVISAQFTNFEIANIYVNLMSIIALISLICFGLAIFSPDLASNLVTSFQAGKNGQYVLSPFYMWGWGRINTRNAGPFWEPGAFQAFLVVALLMILLVLLPKIQEAKNLKRIKYQFLILCITLLTTQSTTAYVLFILMSLVFLKEIKNLFLTNSIKKGRLLKGFAIFIMVSVGISIIISSNNINDKLSEVDNEYSSVAIRMNDSIQSIEMIKDGGLFGLGKTFYNDKLEATRDISNNSNGLLNMVYTYGVFFGAFYIIFYKKGIDSFFSIKNSKKKYFIYLVFILFYLTEGIYWLSVFLLFLFETKTYTYKKSEKNYGGS